MTTFAEEKVKCAVCVSIHEYTVIVSTSSFGAPDLDFRPDLLERDTMFT